MSNIYQVTTFEFNNYYKYVSVQTSKKERKKITIDGLQGSIMSPILLIAYINDMKEAILENNMFVFADDATILTKQEQGKCRGRHIH